MKFQAWVCGFLIELLMRIPIWLVKPMVTRDIYELIDYPHALVVRLSAHQIGIIILTTGSVVV